MSSSPSDQQTVKLETAPFAVLVNSYLLKSSMTPQKLSKLARKKYQLDNKNRNLRKRVLNRIIYKSVTKYTIWSNKRRQTVNNIDSETKPKRAYIKIVNRKRKTDGNKSDSTVKKHKLDKKDCPDDKSNDVENLQQEEKDKENEIPKEDEDKENEPEK